MRSHYVFILLVGVLGVALLAGPGGAGATGASWEPFRTPNPVTPTGYLDAVSCGAAGHCVGVGYYTNGQGDVVPLAEVGSGAVWSLAAPVIPPGAGLSVLNAVACQPDGTCEAVGFYNDAASNVHSFAERYSAGTWALQDAPAPVGARDAGLLGLECQSATNCFAVGNYTDASGDSLVLGERWTGSAWSPQYVPSPGPSVAVASQLDAISCVPARCSAVGSYHTADGRDVPLTEALTASGWHVQVTSVPTTSVAAILQGVSCENAGDCIAVGYWTDSMGNESVLAEHRTNPSAPWVLTSVPSVGTAQGPSSLSAISCVSAKDCTAAGSASIGALIEHWNGTTWTRQLSGAAQRSAATAISCSTDSACVLAGYVLTDNKIPGPLLDTYNGVGWLVATGVPAPNGAVTADLAAVSCSAAGLCSAVGDQTSPSGLVTSALVARLTGGVWTMQAVSGAGSLVGVSCPDDLHCVAAGYRIAQGTSRSVVVAWNGTVWKSAAVPTIAGSTGSDLRAVSCVSATSCMAVGEYSDASGNTLALAARLVGGHWQLVAVPLPTGTAYAALTGVSCVASRCTVVGNAGTADGQQRRLIEVWSGTSWTIQHAAVPVGALGLQLQAVSCATSTTCTLVGSWVGGQGVQYSLVEKRTGVAWAVQPTPNPADVVSSTLQGVTCTATGCAAVGNDYGLGPSGLPAPEQSFAETSDGGPWGLQSVDLPPGTGSSVLAGVSCSAGECVAVGYRFASSGRMVTLAVGG